MMLAVTAPSFIQFKILLVKNDAREKLEVEHLQILHINSHNIQWNVEEKEIRIGERLFDVKEIMRDANGFVVTGIYDDEESALTTEMHKLWSDRQSKQALILLKYYQFLNTACFYDHRFERPLAAPKKVVCTSQPHFYDKEIFLKIPYPPPQQNNHF